MQSVTQQINTQLVTLKLSGIRAALSQQSEQPNLYVEQSFEERLCLLLDHEITQRDQRKIDRLTRQAKFRVNGTLAQLDYGASRQLNKTQIRSLAQGEWLRLHQNILITGTGCGKTILLVRWVITTASREKTFTTSGSKNCLKRCLWHKRMAVIESLLTNSHQRTY